MNLIVVTGPAEEPVTLTEAKAHLRVSGSDEDTYITSLIVAARERAEAEMWRALITQTLRVYLDAWPEESYIMLPRAPLQSVSYVRYYDEDDTENTFSTADYIVSTSREPGRIYVRANSDWPSSTLRVVDGVAVQFVAGYGAAAAVPQIIKQALLLIIGHWFENREEVVMGAGVTRAVLPMAADSIFRQHRAW